MKITQFIEHAIEGGSDLDGHYQNKDGLGYPSWVYEDGYIHFRQTILGFGGDPTRYEWKVSISDILLNPLAWKAVGKVEGWVFELCIDHARCCSMAYPAHIQRMYRMIDALADGKSLEQYLETL